MAIRRVVTAHRGGKAVVIADNAIPPGDFAAIPGFAMTTLWGTQAPPAPGGAATPEAPTVLPPRGGSRFLIVSFPPDAVYADPGFDGAAAGAEQATRLGDLAAAFEQDAPGMHRTDTLDYAIVLAGAPVLELDDGHTTALAPGDTVIQQGTRHAWRNPGDTPATIAFVMLGDAAAAAA